MATAAAALVLTTRLSRDYVASLERSLLKQGVDVDLGDRHGHDDAVDHDADVDRPPPSDPFPRHRLKSSIPRRRGGRSTPRSSRSKLLRSRDRERILGLLRDRDDLPATLIPHVIPLLAWDAVANEAVDALRRVAEEHIGALTDALIDPNQDFAVRRRLARVFSVCVSQRAVDGLLLGLDDVRFEVRFHCARSLALILEKNPRVHVSRDRVFEVVLAEVEVGRPVWEGHRLLREIEAQDDRVFADEFVKDRASRSLSHVFTLLSLVLPFEPLQISYRGLHTADDKLRGTALEYLDSVLPKPIREGLWPYLEEQRAPGTGVPPARADPRRSDAVESVDRHQPRGTAPGRCEQGMAKQLKRHRATRAHASAHGQFRDPRPPDGCPRNCCATRSGGWGPRPWSSPAAGRSGS